MINIEIGEELLYRPKTRETKNYYEQMLVIIRRHMGDLPLDTIKGALDEVICILKREGAKDIERKKEIESLEIDRLTD